MSLFARIERILEDAVEGTSSRLFRAPLQPVQLAKAASRALQEGQVIGPDGPSVANRYRILLHSEDFSRFAGYRSSLQSQIERYLDRFAADRGLRPVAGWHVQLDCDDDVRPRTVRVEASMADDHDAEPAAPIPERPARPRATAEVGDGVDRPEAVPERAAPRLPERPPPGFASGAVTPAAQLVAEDGRRFALRSDVTSLGRALDNDVVIADNRVSRYHAQVRRTGHAYTVHDLDSTNGTAVLGRRVTDQPVASGDEISLGGFKLVLRQATD